MGGFGVIVGAFFSSLLPRINLSWFPLPPLPSRLTGMSAPGWVRYLDIAHWLSWPDVTVPGCVQAAFEQKKLQADDEPN